MEPVSKHGGAKVRFPPPLVYVATIVVAELLDRFVTSLSIPLALAPRAALAAAIFIAGVGLGAVAQTWFRRTGQSPVPWKPSSELLMRGIYARTRNPMYVGMTLMQLGIGIALGKAWIVIAAPLALAIVHVIAVLPEEAYLEHKFGDSYARYKATVRRYL